MKKMKGLMKGFMFCAAPILWANLMILAGSDIRFFAIWVCVTLAALGYECNNAPSIQDDKRSE